MGLDRPSRAGERSDWGKLVLLMKTIDIHIELPQESNEYEDEMLFQWLSDNETWAAIGGCSFEVKIDGQPFNLKRGNA